MSDTLTLNNLTTGYNISLLNANFQAIQTWANSFPLLTQSGQNTMSQDLDMNSHSLLNLATDYSDPSSMVTLGFLQSNYMPFAGGTFTGNVSMGGKVLTGLTAPSDATDAVRNQDLQAENAGRVAADQNLQAQISGGQPLEASAFSPISWHVQTINNSVAIPANVNAWSFGPTIAIASGQTVTIGTGSFWTVANGQVHS